MTRIIRVTKCADCPFNAIDAWHGTLWCQKHVRAVEDGETIPDWCPLEVDTVDTAAKP